LLIANAVRVGSVFSHTGPFYGKGVIAYKQGRRRELPELYAKLDELSPGLRLSAIINPGTSRPFPPRTTCPVIVGSFSLVSLTTYPTRWSSQTRADRCPGRWYLQCRCRPRASSLPMDRRGLPAKY
jgi:hypothetical protein